MDQSLVTSQIHCSLFGCSEQCFSGEKHLNGQKFQLEPVPSPGALKVRVSHNTDAGVKHYTVHAALLKDFITALSLMPTARRGRPITFEQAKEYCRAKDYRMMGAITTRMLENLYNHGPSHLRFVWSDHIMVADWLKTYGCRVPMVLCAETGPCHYQEFMGLDVAPMGMHETFNWPRDALIAVCNMVPLEPDHPLDNELTSVRKMMYRMFPPSAMTWYSCRLCGEVLYSFDEDDIDVVCPMCCWPATSHRNRVRRREDKSLYDEEWSGEDLPIHGGSLTEELKLTSALEGYTSGDRVADYIRRRMAAEHGRITRTSIPCSSNALDSNLAVSLASESDSALYDLGVTSSGANYQMVVNTVLSKLTAGLRKKNRVLVVGYGIPLLVADELQVIRLEDSTLDRLADFKPEVVVFLNVKPSNHPLIEGLDSYVVFVKGDHPFLELEVLGEEVVSPDTMTKWENVPSSHPGFSLEGGLVHYDNAYRDKFCTIFSSTFRLNNNEFRVARLFNTLIIDRPTLSRNGLITWEKRTVALNPALLRIGVNAVITNGASASEVLTRIAGAASITWKVAGSANVGIADQQTLVDHAYMAFVIGTRRRLGVEWRSSHPVITSVAEFATNFLPDKVKDLMTRVSEWWQPLRLADGGGAWSELERYTYQTKGAKEEAGKTNPDCLAIIAKLDSAGTRWSLTESDSEEDNTTSGNDKQGTTGYNAGQEVGRSRQPTTQTNARSENKPKANGKKENSDSPKGENNSRDARPTTSEMPQVAENKTKVTPAFKILSVGQPLVPTKGDGKMVHHIVKFAHDPIAATNYLKGEASHVINDGVLVGPPLGQGVAHPIWKMAQIVKMDAPNSGTNTCGFEALRSAGFALPDNATCRSITNTGDSSMTNEDDLVKLVDLTKEGLAVINSGFGNLSLTLHGSGQKKVIMCSNGHWVHLRQAALGVLTGCGPTADVTAVDTFKPNHDNYKDRLLNLQAANGRAFVARHYPKRPTMVGNHLCNNAYQVHAPSAGLIHQQVVDHDLARYLRDWLNTSNTQLLDDARTLTELDVSDSPSEWYKNLVQLHVTALIDYSEWHTNPSSAKFKPCHDARLYPDWGSGLTLIETESTPLHHGDIIRFTVDNECKYERIHEADGKTYIPDLVDHQSSVAKCVISLPTEVTRLSSLLAAGDRSQTVFNLLHSARLHVGPPGSGKTHHLVEANCDFYVTRTSRARQNLASRLSKQKLTGEVNTLEGVIRRGVELKGKVGIDEAGMFTPLDLMYIISPSVSSLYLTADADQIQTTDFIYLAGERKLRPITYHVTNPTNLMTVRRFGPPLLNVYNDLANQKYQAASMDKTTSFSIVSCSTKGVDDVLKSEKPDTILVFYQRHISMVNRILKATDTKAFVSTVHSYQGSEADRVLILVFPPPNMSESHKQIHKDRQYWISAISRSRIRTAVAFIDAEGDKHYSTIDEYLHSKIHGTATTVMGLLSLGNPTEQQSKERCMDMIYGACERKAAASRWVKTKLSRPDKDTIKIDYMGKTITLVAKEDYISHDAGVLLPAEYKQYLGKMTWTDRLGILESKMSDETREQPDIFTSSLTSEAILTMVAWTGRMHTITHQNPATSWQNWALKLDDDYYLKWNDGCTANSSYTIIKGGKAVGVLSMIEKKGRNLTSKDRIVESQWLVKQIVKHGPTHTLQLWMDVHWAGLAERAWAHITRSFNILFADGSLYRNTNSTWLTGLDGRESPIIRNLGDMDYRKLPKIMFNRRHFRADEWVVDGVTMTDPTTFVRAVAQHYVKAGRPLWLDNLLANMVRLLLGIKGRKVIIHFPGLTQGAAYSNVEDVSVKAAQRYIDAMHTRILDRRGSIARVQPGSKSHTGWVTPTCLTTAPAGLTDGPASTGAFLIMNLLIGLYGKTVVNKSRYQNAPTRTDPFQVKNAEPLVYTDHGRTIADLTAKEVHRAARRLKEDIATAKKETPVANLQAAYNALTNAASVDGPEAVDFLGLDWVEAPSIPDGNWVGMWPATITDNWSLQSAGCVYSTDTDLYRFSDPDALNKGLVRSMGVVSGFHIIVPVADQFEGDIVVKQVHPTPGYTAFSTIRDGFKDEDKEIVLVKDADYSAINRMRLDKNVTNEELLAAMLSRHNSITYSSSSVNFKVDGDVSAVIQLWANVVFERAVDPYKAQFSLLDKLNSTKLQELVGALDIPGAAELALTLVNKIKDLSPAMSVLNSITSSYQDNKLFLKSISPSTIVTGRWEILRHAGGGLSDCVDREDPIDDDQEPQDTAHAPMEKPTTPVTNNRPSQEDTGGASPNNGPTPKSQTTSRNRGNATRIRVKQTAKRVGLISRALQHHAGVQGTHSVSAPVKESAEPLSGHGKLDILTKLAGKLTNSAKAAAGQLSVELGKLQTTILPAKAKRVNSLDEVINHSYSTLNREYLWHTIEDLDDNWDLFVVLTGARGDMEPMVGVGRHYEAEGARTLWWVTPFALNTYKKESFHHCLVFTENIADNLKFAMGLAVPGPLDGHYVTMGDALASDPELQKARTRNSVLTYTASNWPLVQHWGGRLFWLHPVPMFAMDKGDAETCGCPVEYNMFKGWMDRTSKLAHQLGEPMVVGQNLPGVLVKGRHIGVWRADGILLPTHTESKRGTIVTLGSLTPHLTEDMWAKVLAGHTNWPQPITIVGCTRDGFASSSAYTAQDIAESQLVVHHGGAGTFWTAALAQTNQIVRPFFFDQPFWSKMADTLRNDDLAKVAYGLPGTTGIKKLPEIDLTLQLSGSLTVGRGLYRANLISSTITFNPSGADDCIPKCLKKYGMHKHLVENPRDHMDHILCAAAMSGRNVVIADGDMVTIMVNTPTAPLAGFAITDSKFSRHCNAAVVAYGEVRDKVSLDLNNGTGAFIRAVKWLSSPMVKVLDPAKPVKYEGLSRPVGWASSEVSGFKSNSSLGNRTFYVEGRRVPAVESGDLILIAGKPGSVVLSQAGGHPKSRIETGQHLGEVTDEGLTIRVVVDGTDEEWRIWSGFGERYASRVLPTSKEEAATVGTAKLSDIQRMANKFDSPVATSTDVQPHVMLHSIGTSVVGGRNLLVSSKYSFSFVENRWVLPPGGKYEFNEDVVVGTDRPFKWEAKTQQNFTRLEKLNLENLGLSTARRQEEDRMDLPSEIYLVTDSVAPTAMTIHQRLERDPFTSQIYSEPMVPEIPVDLNKSSWAITNYLWPSRIVRSVYEKYTEHPETIYFVMAKSAMVELNTVSNKNAGALDVMSRPMTPQEIKNRIMRLLRPTAHQLVVVDNEATIEWVNNHHSPNRVKRELLELVSTGQLEDTLKKINFSIKTESLLKPDRYTSNSEIVARSILWHPYSIAAIFSPVFKCIKNNLKHSLIETVKYTDGLRPDQVRAIVRTARFEPGQWVVEDDLSKQDRQTRGNLIEGARLVDVALGMDEELSKVWVSCHTNWRFKGNSITGVGNEQRLTGQANTSLGNVETNLAVHSDIASDHRCALMLVNGDDNIAITSAPIDTENHRKFCRSRLNMVSKIHKHDSVGTFCTYLIGKGDGEWDLTPDPVRLRQKFELTHGTAKMTAAVHVSRVQSYISMLGPLKEFDRVRNILSTTVQPTQWYDYDLMIRFTMTKYNITESEVYANIRELANMMCSDPISHSILHWA